MSRERGVVVVATKNAGKVREFAHAFEPFGLAARSMFDYEGLPDIVEEDRKSTRLNSSHIQKSRMPSSA